MRGMFRFCCSLLLVAFINIACANPATVKLTNQSIQQSNSKKFYTWQIEYPVIQSPNVTNQQKFNQLLKELVNHQIDLFKKDLEKAVPEQALRLKDKMNEKTNTLFTESKVYNQIYPLMSVQLIHETSFATLQAHPVKTVDCVNYHLRLGKKLKLSDFTSMDQDLLHRVSLASEKELLKNFKKEALFTEGYSEDWKNFAYWNINPKGLVITFLPGQVTAANAGLQTITISFDALGRKFHLS